LVKGGIKMGDILSKLQMVSEKIGVTETAHTIEEQVDLISESLDKIPHSTNIAEALDDLSEVAQNINNEEVYVDKTITENGTYLPAEDEATAYSKVVVDVAVNFEYIIFPLGTTATHTNSVYNVLFTSSDNNYILPTGQDLSLPGGSYDACLSTPANNINCTTIESGRIVFTPGENCQFVNDSGAPISVSGDTITPLDGKVYYLTKWIDFSSGDEVYEVTKTNRNFVYNVVS
jgi:uncharacterized protein YkvS